MRHSQNFPSSEPRQSSIPTTHGRQGTHYAIFILGLLTCCWAIWNSGREGISTLLSSYASTINQLEAADKAARLSPSSSDAHYVRARLLSQRDQLAEAIKAYERAASLRPHDYVLVLELGRARDQANDVEGAVAAFRESVRLAPFYAQPHWQLGNTLLRSGRRDEALVELRGAATSDPKLLPAAINLAWAVFNGDPRAVEQAIQPQTEAAHMALASFFARHGRPSEATAHFLAAGGVSNEQRRALLTELLAAKNFSEAYLIWSSGRKTNDEGSPRGLAAIANGGFEGPIPLDDPGFGWQLANTLEAARVSLDENQPHAGAHSLRLDWKGNSDPAKAVISQLVLVEPKTRYRLSFAARTQDLLTIGLPLVTVIDASDKEESVLVQSNALPGGTTGWQDYATEFTTVETTGAVVIRLRRENCATPQCAILGNLWLDDFLLTRL